MKGKKRTQTSQAGNLGPSEGENDIYQHRLEFLARNVEVNDGGLEQKLRELAKLRTPQVHNPIKR